jgi:hypothetical protein
MFKKKRDPVDEFKTMIGMDVPSAWEPPGKTVVTWDGGGYAYTLLRADAVVERWEDALLSGGAKLLVIPVVDERDRGTARDVTILAEKVIAVEDRRREYEAGQAARRKRDAEVAASAVAGTP